MNIYPRWNDSPDTFPKDGFHQTLQDREIHGTAWFSKSHSHLPAWQWTQPTFSCRCPTTSPLCPEEWLYWPQGHADFSSSLHCVCVVPQLVFSPPFSLFHLGFSSLSSVLLPGLWGFFWFRKFKRPSVATRMVVSAPRCPVAFKAALWPGFSLPGYHMPLPDPTLGHLSTGLGIAQMVLFLPPHPRSRDSKIGMLS